MYKTNNTYEPSRKRYFHNPANGTTARVCRHCGAHVYGHNAGICLDCLAKMRKEANNGQR